MFKLLVSKMISPGNFLMSFAKGGFRDNKINLSARKATFKSTSLASNETETYSILRMPPAAAAEAPGASLQPAARGLHLPPAKAPAPSVGGAMGGASLGRSARNSGLGHPQEDILALLEGTLFPFLYFLKNRIAKVCPRGRKSICPKGCPGTYWSWTSHGCAPQSGPDCLLSLLSELLSLCPLSAQQCGPGPAPPAAAWKLRKALELTA